MGSINFAIEILKEITKNKWLFLNLRSKLRLRNKDKCT